ncbi:MAG: hypothetical protein JO202_10985 [Ktedonobacteraceae bacterium]|nr:hypothetical protein [Ktedonobacteraceae bacterium]
MIPHRPLPQPQWGICPRCRQEGLLSVPTQQYGWICIYCLEDLYPGCYGGLQRPHSPTSARSATAPSEDADE